MSSRETHLVISQFSARTPNTHWADATAHYLWRRPRRRPYLYTTKISTGYPTTMAHLPDSGVEHLRTGVVEIWGVLCPPPQAYTDPRALADQLHVLRDYQKRTLKRSPDATLVAPSGSTPKRWSFFLLLRRHSTKSLAYSFFNTVSAFSFPSLECPTELDAAAQAFTPSIFTPPRQPRRSTLDKRFSRCLHGLPLADSTDDIVTKQRTIGLTRFLCPL
jgi:hypothetical protein